MGKLITLGLNTPPLEQRNVSLENPAIGLSNISAIWSWLSGTEHTSSGISISETNSLNIISVYACIRIIADSISTLPLTLYERLGNGRREAVDNYLYNILTVSPNPEMGAVPFWCSVVGCMALTGNAYIFVQRAAGQVVALWPLDPRVTQPVRMPDGTLAYRTSDGMSNNETRTINASDCCHMRLFSFSGLVGLSPIALMRESLGMEKSSQAYASRIFSNGGRPSGLMTQGDNPSTVDEKQLLNIRESWQAAQTGSNQHKTAFLPGNWKYTPLSMSMEDTQFLQTRAFLRSEIAAA